MVQKKKKFSVTFVHVVSHCLGVLTLGKGGGAIYSQAV